MLKSKTNKKTSPNSISIHNNDAVTSVSACRDMKRKAEIVVILCFISQFRNIPLQYSGTPHALLRNISIAMHIHDFLSNIQRHSSILESHVRQLITSTARSFQMSVI